MTDALKRLSRFFDRHPSYRTRGFLPAEDPLTAFPGGSGLETLDMVGNDLPRMLLDPGFRRYMRETFHPGLWFGYCGAPENLAEIRLYYVRLAFIASGYIHQLEQPPVTRLPHGIAEPLVHTAELLKCPRILPYAAYALYNWQRLDKKGPITPYNVETIQNFVYLPDAGGVNQEQWFIGIHVAIEAIAARILDALALYARGAIDANRLLYNITDAVHDMHGMLLRIPEHMDPTVYYKTFRRYIQGFTGVVYEGVSPEPYTLRGETGAQSSIFPLLTALLKIHHERTPLVLQLEDMKNYMPAEHCHLIAQSTPCWTSGARPRPAHGTQR